jgi:hypothetical protein
LLVRDPGTFPATLLLSTLPKRIHNKKVWSPYTLAGLVDEGAARFFLVQDRERMREIMANEDGSSQPSGQQGPSQGFPGGGRGFPQNEATSWVQDNCEKIPQELWQSPEAEEQEGGGPPMRRAQALYDCVPAQHNR